MLVGFDELVLECRNQSSRTHIQEAARCYETGAYRAAIVAAYVAVCFDLIEKLRSLELAGDGAAKTLLTKLSNLQDRRDKNDATAISGLLEFERNLIEEFRDGFEFFGVNEYDELVRLREDRNRCAHPTYAKSNLPYEASAELARLHIRNAVRYVLSQDARQGKAALSSLQATLLSSYFPRNKSAAIPRLKGSEIGSARANLITAFVDDLSFGWATTGSPYFKKDVAFVAISALVEIHRATVLPRLIANAKKLLLNPDKTAITGGVLISLFESEVGEAMGNAERSVVESWLKVENGKTHAFAVRRAFAISWLRPAAVARTQSLSSEQLGQLDEDVPPEMLTAAAKLLSQASTWPDANAIADQVAVPFSDRLSQTDIELVMTAAGNRTADLLGSHGFKAFVDALYQRSPLGKTVLDDILNRSGLSNYIP